MNKHNFDHIIDRNGTHSVKYDGYGSITSDYEQIIPMWVADMDFATPSFITDAIKTRLEHPILGYSIPSENYYNALINWFDLRYGFRPKQTEIAFTPGIVAALYKLIDYFSLPNDAVTIMPPVYFPFANVVKGSKRKLLEAPLIIDNHKFEIDWKQLEHCLSQSKILLFCHPHNPGGRVWSKEELAKVATIAKQNNVLVISDEIHADLNFKGFPHHPFPMVSPDAFEVAISLMAPSKVFNMPGVIASHIYTPNSTLAKPLFEHLENCGLSHGSCFTFDAVTAAYTYGNEWSNACMDYIEQNVRFASEYIENNIPKIKVMYPQASFLLFLDCHELGFSSTKLLRKFFTQKAGVLMNDGATFGKGGEFYMRMNVAAPRSVIEEALKRIEKAVNSL